MRAVSGCVGVLAGVVFLILVAVIPARANLFVSKSRDRPGAGIQRHDRCVHYGFRLCK